MYFRFPLLCLLGCGLSVLAQGPSAQPAAKVANPQSNIQVQVNEVIVPVTVTDEKGRFVSDLEKKDFKIFDEGKEQSIRFFTREHSPAGGGRLPGGYEQCQPVALAEISGSRRRAGAQPVAGR